MTFNEISISCICGKVGAIFYFSAFYTSIIWCWHLLPDTILWKCLNAGFQQFEAYSTTSPCPQSLCITFYIAPSSSSYCMAQTVWNLRLDTLEEWYQETNVSTIFLTKREHENEKNIPNFSTDGFKNAKKPGKISHF